MTRRKPKVRYCSFCGASEREVRKLITGTSENICDGCVRECMKVLADSPDPIGHAPSDQPPSPDAA